MREIKFRAWHEDAKTMLFVGDNHGTIHDMDCCIYYKQGQPVVLMQYTGLKDKNGKEIYEGDVNHDGGLVVWNSDDASFCWEYVGVETQPMGEESYWCEVIGNIYENPEFLQGF